MNLLTVGDKEEIVSLDCWKEHALAVVHLLSEEKEGSEWGKEKEGEDRRSDWLLILWGQFRDRGTERKFGMGIGCKEKTHNE